MRSEGPLTHPISFFFIFTFTVAFAPIYKSLSFDPRSIKLNGQ